MDKRHLLVTNFLLLQLFLLLLLAYNYIFAIFRISATLVLAIVIAASLFNIWTIKELSRLHVIEKQATVSKERIANAQKMILTLRSKHHDFINHLQVIMGLIQLSQPNQAMAYIKDLSKDLIEIEKLITLKKPEIAALISSKVSGLSYVQTNLEISTDLEKLDVQSDKLVSLLGNLLDNAIYEVYFQEEKWITIKIYEKDNWFVFEIINPGTIAKELVHKIFEPGFTTKGEKGTGMGLHIVKELATKLGGQILVDLTTEGAVNFTLKLPR